MPTPERGTDQVARIASLRAFEASLTHDLNAGLAELGPLDDPVRVYGALQLLTQHERFQDAVDLIKALPPHCKWVDLAVYAHIALKDTETAKALLSYADSCSDAWVAERCRIAIADAVFTEVLDRIGGTKQVGESFLTF
jgi:hypothetical protein